MHASKLIFDAKGKQHVYIDVWYTNLATLATSMEKEKKLKAGEFPATGRKSGKIKKRESDTRRGRR